MDNSKFLGHLDGRPAAGYLLWRCSRLWQHQVNKAVLSLGLTNTQAVILAACHQIIARGEKPTLARIIAVTDISKMTASQAVRTLLVKELLTATESVDKRSKYLSLTPEGTRRVISAIEKIDVAHGVFFAEISDESLQELADTLDRLISVMDKKEEME